MINEAMFAKRDKFNEFTISLRRMAEVNGGQLCKLRNQTLMKVFFKPSNGELEDPVFHTEDWDFCWFLDGSSCKNNDLDIVAFGADL